MIRAKGLQDETLQSRVECKYFLRPELMPAVRAFLSPYVCHDPFSAKTPGHRYSVNSLYLDTPARDLYQMTVQGQKNRYKLRIRSYADTDPFVFFEVKRRLNDVIEKDRQRVAREVAIDFLRGRPGAATASGAIEFSRLADLGGILPMLRVKYQREAFSSRMGSPIRVTFDDSLQVACGLQGQLEHGGEGWVDVPLPAVILEVKFTSRFPSWFASMVRTFELRRTSIPKYILCTDRALSTRSVSFQSSRAALR